MMERRRVAIDGGPRATATDYRGFDRDGDLLLTQVNVPDNDFAGVSHGWENFYWTPWRTYLEGRKLAGC
jgi:hypothetical protein